MNNGAKHLSFCNIKEHFLEIILSIMAAASIVLCIRPVIENGLGQLTGGTVYVHTNGGNSVNGASEIWIASTGSFDLEHSPEISIIRGNCEYRKASDYGYQFDFLISYGENSGTDLAIQCRSILKNGLLFYKHPAGGKAIVSYGNSVQTIDTYSETPQMYEINLGSPEAVYAIETIICIAAIAALTFPMFKIATSLMNNEYIYIYNKENRRDPSIDIVRTAAAFFVVLVHSFLADGYYSVPLNDPAMFGLTIIRWLALTCVPLFMLITGYLCINRTSITKSWLGFVPGFALFAVLMVIRSILVGNVIQGVPITYSGLMTDIFGVKYAWYVEMYVGLILLMPFLNKLWAAIDDHNKKTLIGAMLILTCLGTLGTDEMPDYYVFLYPVTYYFIGAYLREKPITIKTWKLGVMLLSVLLLETICTIYTANGGVFQWTTFGNGQCNYNAFIVTVSAVLVFTLLYRIKIKNKRVTALLSFIGKNTLGIYLTSSCFVDNIIYPQLNQYFTTPQSFAVIQLPAVIANFIISLLFAALLNYPITKLWSYIRKKTL